MPDNADKHILDSRARLIEEGKSVAFWNLVKAGNTTQPPITNTPQSAGGLPQIPED